MPSKNGSSKKTTTMSRSSNGGYDWKPIHATGTWHNSRTSWPTETGAGRPTNAAGPETAATSSALSGSTAPALTSTRPNPSGPPWKPAAPPCGAKGPGPHPVRKPMRHGGTATIVVSRKRSPADQVDRWVETHVTFISDKPKLSKATRPSQAAYRHGRRDGARQAIGLKETGQAGNWTLEK